MFEDFGQVFWRTPLYGYDTLIPTCGGSLFSLVAKKLDDAVFLESIYWSSKDLYQRVLFYQAGKLTKTEEAALLRTLGKYLIRSSTRSTPYGIHAGYFLGPVGKMGDQQTAPADDTRRVFVDVSLIRQLVQVIENDSTVNIHLNFWKNNTIYALEDSYRYIDDEDGSIAELDKNDFLKEIYDYRGEEITRAQLHEWIGAAIAPDEREALIIDLIHTGFIFPVTRKAISLGLAYLRKVMQGIALKAAPEAGRYIRLLDKIQQLSVQLNGEYPLGKLPLQALDRLDLSLQRMGLNFLEKPVFHVDLVKAGSPILSLNRPTIKRIQEAIAVLSRVSSKSWSLDQGLDKFKKAFVKRYGTAELPLLEVVDDSYGIGFPCQDGLGVYMHNIWTADLMRKNPVPAAESVEKDSWLQVWLKGEMLRINDSETDKREIVLEDADLPAASPNAWSNQFAVMGSLLPNGNIFLRNAGGPNGVALIGRFTYTKDVIQQFAQQIAVQDADTNKDCIYAEVIYLPKGHVGNVTRPTGLYTFEIPILLSGSDTSAHRLRLDDLLVSVVDDQVVLRSKAHNRRVIPRINHAYNYGLSELAPYRFLSAIQHQGNNGLHFVWGSWAKAHRFLPRVSYKGVILQRALWRWSSADLDRLQRSENPILSLREMLHSWRAPARLLLLSGDNELYIDTQQEDYLKVLWGEMKAMREGSFCEWLFDHEDVRSVKSPFVINEFVLPLRNAAHSFLVKPTPFVSDASMQRSFSPGSSWLYVKIYCNAYHADFILQQLARLVKRLLGDKLIKQVFFIRYTDPDFHLRLRLKLRASRLVSNLAEVLKLLNKKLESLKSGRYVWKIQWDTYEREVERYGTKHMLHAESVFHIDTQFVFRLIDDQNLIDSAEFRLFIGIKLIDKWLEVFGFDLSERIVFSRSMTNAFSGEFDAELRPQIDHKYRSTKQAVSQFLNDPNYEKIFCKWFEELTTLRLDSINLTSYIHMSLNRWFHTDSRLMEYMAYLFLTKYYLTMKHVTNKKGLNRPD